MREKSIDMREKPVVELLEEGISPKSLAQRTKQIMNIERDIKLLFVKKNEEYRTEKLENIQTQIDNRMWRWRRIKYLSRIKPGAQSIFHPSEIGAYMSAWKYTEKLRRTKKRLDKQIKYVAEEFVMKYANDSSRPSDSELSNMIVDHAHERLADTMNIPQSDLIDILDDAYEEMSL